MGVSIVSIWLWRAGKFLDSCWSLVPDENLEMPVLLSVKESLPLSSATGNVNLVARGKAKQEKKKKKKEKLLLKYSLKNKTKLGCYLKVPPTIGVSLHTQVTVVRTILQMRLLSQMILTCCKRTFKGNKNAYVCI